VNIQVESEGSYWEYSTCSSMRAILSNRVCRKCPS